MTITRVVAVVVSLFASAAVAAAQTPLTLGELFAVDSKVMGEQRRVIVWTPPGYDVGARAYPVLYLTDGERQFGHTVTTVEFLSRNGRIPPMIVIGIFNVDRTRDLTPYKDKEDDTQLPTAGGADRFLEFIETELVPWVEGQYRTEKFRAFAGHSFGGLFALHTLATRPALFNAIIAVSPSLPWRQGEAVKRIDTTLAQQRTLKASLYVTLGDEGAAMKSGLDRLRRCSTRRLAKAFGGTWSRCSTRTTGRLSFGATTRVWRRSSMVAPAARALRDLQGRLEGRGGPLRQTLRSAGLAGHAARADHQRIGVRRARRTQVRRRPDVSAGQCPELPRKRECL